MIVFDPKLKKSLTMTVESEGIEPSKLQFTFRLLIDGIEYGFPCSFEQNKVKVEIPALEEVIKKIKNGKYSAKLEVNGDDKFYLKPFNEQVEIKKQPVLDVLLDTDDKDSKDDVAEKLKIAVSEMLEEDQTTIGFDIVKKKDDGVTDPKEEDEKKSKKKKKKKSKISKFIEG